MTCETAAVVFMVAVVITYTIFVAYMFRQFDKTEQKEKS